MNASLAPPAAPPAAPPGGLSVGAIVAITVGATVVVMVGVALTGFVVVMGQTARATVAAAKAVSTRARYQSRLERDPIILKLGGGKLVA